MQRTGYDSDLAALQAGAGLPGHVLDVVVLSADPGVLATLRGATGQEHAIWHAQSADAAVDFLVGGRCSILVADIATLRGDAAALLANLHVQFPELVLMATGRREEESAVAALVGDGRIYRFLHKPISPARASLFITAATRRYNELRNVEPLALATVRTIAARPKSMWVIAAAALLLLTMALWLTLRAGDSQDPALPQHPATQVTHDIQIADNLARAQMAYATGRLTEPLGNNALDYFRAVLAADAGNAEARAGLERVAAALEGQVTEALRMREPAKGAAALNALRRVQPGHPRLDQLYTDLLTLSRSVNTQPSPARRQPNRPTKQARAPQPPAPTTDEAQSAQATGADGSEPQPASTNEPVSESLPAETPEAASPSAEQMDEISRLRESGALHEIDAARPHSDEVDQN